MLRKLFVFVVCLVAAVATASAQTPPDNEIWYTTTDGKKLNGDFSNMVSNSYNNGRGVLKFQNCITNIRGSAFAGCSSLKSITIPNSVTYIGERAFEGCSSLKSITIPNSVTSIGEWAFYGCSSLTGITIPNSVTSIGDWVFRGCSSLKSITIPDSVTYIGVYAFSGCSSLKSITIPNSETHIGYCAFEGCTSLNSVKVSNKNWYDYFKNFGVSDITFIVSTPQKYEEAQEVGATKLAIDSNSKYASKDGRCLIDNGKLILFIGKDLTEYTIPESVTEIGYYAFRGCSSLKSFKGKFASEDGRCLIKDGELIAFAPAGLTSYTIPNSVTNIGASAFRGCSSLTSITIPNSVTSIGASAFRGCSSLTSINIPNSVTEIGWYAFRGCIRLKSITIPESVTSIDSYAFKGCSSLKSVKVSNKYCYDYFKKLGISDITFIVSTPQKYEEAQKLGATKLAIDSNSKYASNDGLCLIDNGKLILFIGKDLTECTIPESVTSIGERAFKGCSSLKSFKGKFASEDGRCLIKDGELIAFAPAGLTSYTIPNSVTSIGRYTFSDCSSLTSITIPNSITSIGDYAFYDCSRLKSVKVSNKYCYDYFKDKVANIAFYGANASDDGRCLIIDGELNIFIAKGITEYTIPESVTSIGHYTFSDCSSITSITIPNSVTSIGEWAFKYCRSLTSITIPNSVTKIGGWAFYGCSSLTSITIPESVTSIGESAFWGCTSLTSITCLATTPPAIDNLRIGETTMIYVPKEGVKAYKKDPDWSIYKKQIKAIK